MKTHKTRFTTDNSLGDTNASITRWSSFSILRAARAFRRPESVSESSMRRRSSEAGIRSICPEFTNPSTSRLGLPVSQTSRRPT